MKFSIVAILVLTSAIAFEFQSRFALNVGISLTLLTFLVSLPAIHSFRNQPMAFKGRKQILNACLLFASCAAINSALLISVFIFAELPNRLSQ